MFPLGSVLFPQVPLPLRIFEPRYRQMIEDCLAADLTFGVVLIERGHEVGGGDVRSSLGTLATIARAQEHPDGTWTLTAVGTARLRVDRWLDDDPYPVAMVTDIPEDPSTQTLEAELLHADRAVRRALELAVALSPGADPDFDAAALPFDAEPTMHLSQLCAVAPVTSYDRQELLACDPDQTRSQVRGLAGLLMFSGAAAEKPDGR